MTRYVPPGFGWTCSLPAFEEVTYLSADIKQILFRLPVDSHAPPDEVDLRDFFPAVDKQRSDVSSSIHACCGLVEYFERRVSGNMRQPSAMFTHHAINVIMQTQSTRVCDNRTALTAISKFGLLPEKFFPYTDESITATPEASLYQYAQPYAELISFRIDRRNQCGDATLETMKLFLAAGFPVVFGFSVPESISEEGDVPFRPHYDTLAGGQAVIAVGYDDRHLRASKGALLIRNSWGQEWGEKGYGWLPYAYVTEQWASDCWCVLQENWLNSGEFTRPRLPEFN